MGEGGVPVRKVGGPGGAVVEGEGDVVWVAEEGWGGGGGGERGAGGQPPGLSPSGGRARGAGYPIVVDAVAVGRL